MTLLKTTLFFLLHFVSFLSNAQQKSLINKSKPNIVYILADDLGYGDISCYGQEKFSTPNIDKLAKDGMLFTQHYSGSAVCAPSRSALLSGLHTGHTVIRGNKGVEPEGEFPLPKSTFTIAELLIDKGYRTGAFGKWGLGYPSSTGDPLQQGFDAFYGYNSQLLAHNYYPDHLWENRNKVILTENEGTKKGQYAPDLIHQKAMSFIEENKNRSFFLYYASVLPHAELIVPDSYLDKFKGKYNPEKVYKSKESPKGFKNGEYSAQPDAHAAFVAMVTLLDNQVGEIVAKIKELGIEDNTLIIFTSDNGPHQEGGADPDYFNSNGPLRGYKRDLYEGGIRVPMIAKWKGKISAGSTTNHISAFWDVMPTFAELVKGRIDNDIDGISFLPTLVNTGFQKKHNYLYWEFHELNGRQAIRQENWKLLKYNVNKNGSYQLYNLENDVSEKNDLASQMPEKVTELAKILESTRTESEVFQFK
jgi:arylsulfatase A-like enzyme